MKMISLFKVKDMKKAIVFYTGVLDFGLKYPGTPDDDWVVDLVNGDAELQLTVLEGDYLYGSVVNVWVDEVDELFKKYVSRGHVPPSTDPTLVHSGPLNQSWGNREFYITDEWKNTLRFCTPLE